MIQSKKENIMMRWFIWHFYETPAFLVSVWKNYIAFGLHYFSMPLLLATLFAPWKKYHWKYPKGFDAKEYFGIFISNIYSRMMGVFLRLLLIMLGVIAQVFIIIIGVLVILFWLAVPFVIIALLLFLLYV